MIFTFWTWEKVQIFKKKKVVKYQTVFSTNDPKHLIAEIWLWGPHVIPCLVFFIQLPHDNSNVCVSNFVLCFNVEKFHVFLNLLISVSKPKAWLYGKGKYCDRTVNPGESIGKLQEGQFDEFWKSFEYIFQNDIN